MRAVAVVAMAAVAAAVAHAHFAYFITVATQDYAPHAGRVHKSFLID